MVGGALHDGLRNGRRVESMMAALVPETGRDARGGKRSLRRACMKAQICSRYRIAHERNSGPWMDAPDLAGIAASLDARAGEPPFTHLAVVHHETTTGRLNDLNSLANLCRSRSVKLLVDGVSSFGAEKIDFADATLAAVAATANKCLHAVPGASASRHRTAKRSERSGEPRLCTSILADSPFLQGSARYTVHAGSACLLRLGRGATRTCGPRGPLGSL